MLNRKANWLLCLFSSAQNLTKIYFYVFIKRVFSCPFPLQFPVATCQNYEISNGRTMHLQGPQFQGSCSSWCRLLRDPFLGPRTALPVETRARFSRCEFCPQTGTNPAKKGQVVSISSIWMLFSTTDTITCVLVFVYSKITY